MLKLVIQGMDSVDTLKIVTDVQYEMSKLKIVNNKLNSEVIKKIDKATLLDNGDIIDRFGNKTSIENISTGCKAVLVLANNPDKTVSLMEYGVNAVQTALRLVTDGSALIGYKENYFSYTSAESEEAAACHINHKDYSVTIAVYNQGYRFNSLKRLAYYIKNEKPFKLDTKIPGAKLITNEELNFDTQI